MLLKFYGVVVNVLISPFLLLVLFSLLLLFLDSLFGCLWQCKVNLFLRYIYRFEGGKVV